MKETSHILEMKKKGGRERGGGGEGETGQRGGGRGGINGKGSSWDVEEEEEMRGRRQKL